MAERRKDTFKKTLTGSSTERRRDASERFRKDKRDKAMQLKRRRMMEEMEGGTEQQDGMMEAEDDWTPETVQAAILGFQAAVAGGDGGAVVEATRQLRKLLCLREPPTEYIISAGVLPQFISLLCAAQTSEEIKLEVMWCLTNVAAGTHEETKSVLPATPYLITFILPGPIEALREQACWVLGNVAADGPELRSALQAQGALPPLVRILKEATKPSLQSTAAWALSHLAKGSETSARPFAEAGLFPVLATRLRDAAHEDVVKEVAWVLAFLTTRDEQSVNELLSLGVAQGLGDVLSAVAAGRTGLSVGTPVLRAVANLLAGGDPTWTEAVLRQASFLPSLRALLASHHVGESRALIKETLWTVANVASSQAAAVLGHDMMGLVLNYFRCGQFDIQREALLCIYNVVAASPNYLQTLIESESGVLATMLDLLKVPDAEVVSCVLSLLELVVRNVPGGTQRILELNAETIENLQYGNHDERIRSQASRIIDVLYEEDEEDDLTGGGGGAGFDFRMHQPAPAPAPAFGAPDGAGGRGRGRHLNVPAWQANASALGGDG